MLGWSCLPSEASERSATLGRHRALMWRANYHPDGGQMFFPLENAPFVVPMALPGDDVTPQDFKAFWFDGSKGLYMHPNVWHDGVFPRPIPAAISASRARCMRGSAPTSRTSSAAIWARPLSARFYRSKSTATVLPPLITMPTRSPAFGL